MDRAELYAAWQGDNGFRPTKHRPQWVREHRDALAEHIETDEPIPAPDASTAEYRDWLSRYKATVTRQLSPDGGENGKDTDTEGDA